MKRLPQIGFGLLSLGLIACGLLARLPQVVRFTNGHVREAGALSAFVVVALCFTLAFALAPRLGARKVLVGLLVTTAAFAGVSAGGLYATCDLAMRRFLPEMIAVLGSLALLVQPLWGFGFLVCVFALAAAIGWVEGRLQRRLGAVATAALVLVLALVSGGGSYLTATALGNRPTKGACVL